MSGGAKFIYSAAKKKRRAANRARMNKKRKRTRNVAVPNGYRPGEVENFMNPVMREYFRQKLLHWKGELVRESTETIQHLQEESLHEADLADRASVLATPYPGCRMESCGSE